MENEERDIIQHLAEKLRDSEHPYREGAWERYAAKQAKVEGRHNANGSSSPTANIRSQIRPWMGIAASILLAIGAGWLYLASIGPGQQTGNILPADQIAISKKPTKTINEKAGPTVNNAVVEDNHDKVTNADHHLTALMNNKDNYKFPNNNTSTNTYATFNVPFSFPYNIGHTNIITLNNQFSARDRVVAKAISNNALAAIDAENQPTSPQLRIFPLAGILYTTAPPIATADQKGTTSTIMAKGSQSQTKNTASKISPASGTSANNNPTKFDDKGYFNPDEVSNSRRWNMGVMVIPAVSNDAKINVGYGVSVGYKLSNKISINSGLAYSQITGSKTPDQQQATIASGGRMLSSIDASANGLNVPLEIRYHISQKIYVGTGVSGMAVLSDKVERKYAIASMQTSAFEARNGQPLKPDAMQSIASSMQKKEVIPQDQIGSKNFAGFINFTFGFKQPLNKSKSISIEPFISVPMSNHVFNQNIKLTDGGIRIKLGL